MVYYNEFDEKKAAWLRELIKCGLIAPGDVDERSITLVQPGDLRGFAQCHFFAGIGVWSYALRRAGWADERPIWTASCPCQPFSAAGKQKGFADERHLWPELFRLVRECRPKCIVGEQVAKRNGLAWLDLVSDDLEGSGYACGAVVSPACGYGAPQIRERLYWVARAGSEGLEERQCKRGDDGAERATAERSSEAGGLGGTTGRGCGIRGQQALAGSGGHADGTERPSFWAGCDWVLTRPQRLGDPPSLRPVKPMAQRLADGNTGGVVRSGDRSFPLTQREEARVLRLRGYGDAIVAPQAEEFIKAVMEVL